MPQMGIAPRVAGWRRRYAGMPAPVRPSGPDLRSPLVELLLGGQWVDITRLSRDEPGVYYEDAITITRGRPNESSQVDTAQCAFTINNRGGWASPRNPLSPWYGMLGRNTPVRVSVVQGGERRYRFYGEIPEWPQRWDSTGTDVRVPINAAGVIRRLTQGSAPLRSTLYRGLTSDTVRDLRAYWPCEDQAGSTSLASAIGGPPMRITGTPDLAAFSDFDCSDAIPTMGTSDWTGVVPPYPRSSAIQVRWLMAVPSTGATNDESIMKLFCSGTAEVWHLVYATGGVLSIEAYAGPDLDTQLFTSPAAFAVNGKLLRVSIELEQNGADVDWNIATVEPGIRPGLTWSGTLTGRTIGRAKRVVMNNGGGLGTDVAMGHVSVQSVITDVFDFEDELAAYRGEFAATRTKRLCDENGVNWQQPVDVRTGIVANSETMGPQLPKTLIDLLRDCADTDGGILYEPRDQLGIGYRRRSMLYLQDPKVTLDYSAAELAESLEPTDDDQLTRNDVTVTRERGTSARVVKETGPLNIQDPAVDADGVGRYDEAVTLSVAYGERASDLAGWRVHLGTTDEPRYPRVTVNMKRSQISSNAELENALFTVDLGDRLVIENLPAWMPPGPASQIVQGYAERFTNLEHTITFNCSPESPYRVARWSIPIGEATGQGTSATPDYLVATDADASDIEVGDRVVIYNASDAVRFGGDVFTIESKESFAGFTNVFFTPDAPASTVSGDVMKVVVDDGIRYGSAGAEVAAATDTANIRFVDSAATLNAASTGDVTVSVPAGTANGDVMIALIGLISQTAITAPAGWTLIGTAQDAGANTRYAAYYRVASSEPASYLWDWASTFKNSGVIATYRGVDPTDPIEDFDSNGTAESGTSFPTDEVATAKDGAWLVSGAFERHAFTGAATTWSSNDPSDAERYDNGSNAGSGQDIAHAVYDTARPLTPGSYSRTLTTSQTVSQVATWSIALKPDQRLSVATTEGPLWTTDHDEMPFDIVIGGERMTVTAITGASSPQTFTVTRGQNGINKAHPVGAKVELFRPAYRAL